MKKMLFFDDSLLFGRDNVERVYGKAERIAEYNDGICSTDYCSGNVFKLDNGKLRLLYFGHSRAFRGKKLFSAISDDGICFTPENVNIEGESAFAHEIMTLPSGAEIACIYEDQSGGPRYKLLMCELDGQALSVYDTLYVSDDLLHWSKMEKVYWGDGTEPVTSVYFNEAKKHHVILQRPFWGVRAVGCKTTQDWENFTDYRYALGVDSEDEPLAEIYGMFGFAYDGMYVGVPHIYRNLRSEYNAKYKNGIIDCQLAYSYDGEYWRRSLNEPFLTGGDQYQMVWLSGIYCRKNDILLYGTASKLEHGPAFHEPGNGTLFVYRLRRDGFIALVNKDSALPSRIITREKIWNGGDLHINVNAKNVTVAVYETNESEMVSGNVLGIAKPIDGFSADDCIAFSGDCVDYIPRFREGKTLNMLAGKTLVFEINYSDGALYSLSGDYTDVFNTEGARYRKFGVLPKR